MRWLNLELPLYQFIQKIYCPTMCQTLCLGMGRYRRTRNSRSLFIFSLELGVGKMGSGLSQYARTKIAACDKGGKGSEVCCVNHG